MIAIRGEPAPLTLTAKPDHAIVAQGRLLNLEISVTRRAGFAEAVAVAATELPPNVPTVNVSIAKDAKVGRIASLRSQERAAGPLQFRRARFRPYPFNKRPQSQGEAKH